MEPRDFNLFDVRPLGARSDNNTLWFWSLKISFAFDIAAVTTAAAASADPQKNEFPSEQQRRSGSRSLARSQRQ